MRKRNNNILSTISLYSLSSSTIEKCLLVCIDDIGQIEQMSRYVDIYKLKKR